MQTLLFENRDTEKVYFNEKPINLHKNIYMFKWSSGLKYHVFKLVQYSKDGFTWLNVFDNGHFFINPNGRTETLDVALELVKNHDIKVFECSDIVGICDFIDPRKS